MKILVIDDFAGNVASTKQTLKDHEVTIISDSKEAREFLTHTREVEFDVLLTDLYMPDERSTQEFPVGLAFALNAINRGKKVVICTDSDRHEDRLTWLLGMASNFVGQEQNPQLVAFVQLKTCPVEGYWDEQTSQIVMCEDWWQLKEKRHVKNWLQAMENSRLFPELFA